MKIISTIAIALAVLFPALAFAQQHASANAGSDIWLRQPSAEALGQGVYTHH